MPVHWYEGRVIDIKEMSPTTRQFFVSVGDEAFDLLPVQHGARRKGSRSRVLGPELASLDVLLAGYRASSREMAGQLVGTSV